MLDNLYEFLENIIQDGGTVLFEAEALPAKITKFVDEYNLKYNANISIYSEGVVTLHENADKWGLELRMYVPIKPPIHLIHLFRSNTVYKNTYKFRLNDNEIIERLFERGFRLGTNS